MIAVRSADQGSPPDNSVVDGPSRAHTSHRLPEHFCGTRMRTVQICFQLSFNLFRATGRTRIGRNLYRGEQGAAETDLSLAGYQIDFVRACNNIMQCSQPT